MFSHLHHSFRPCLRRAFAGLFMVLAGLPTPGVLLAAELPTLLEARPVLNTLPNKLLKDVSLLTKEGTDARRAATSKLRVAYHDKPCVLKMKVETIEKEKGGYGLHALKDSVRVAGINFMVVQKIHLDPGEDGKVARLNRGTVVTASGLGMVQMGIEGGLPRLTIEINSGRLQ